MPQSPQGGLDANPQACFAVCSASGVSTGCLLHQAEGIYMYLLSDTLQTTALLTVNTLSSL